MARGRSGVSSSICGTRFIVCFLIGGVDAVGHWLFFGGIIVCRVAIGFFGREAWVRWRRGRFGIRAFWRAGALGFGVSFDGQLRFWKRFPFNDSDFVLSQ